MTYPPLYMALIIFVGANLPSQIFAAQAQYNFISRSMFFSDVVDLISAARTGNESRVKRLIVQKIDVTMEIGLGNQSALSVVCGDDYLKCKNDKERLKQKQAIKQMVLNAALFEAMNIVWNVKGVTTLLSLGAHPDAIDAKGQTPLIKAAIKNHWEQAKILLINGASIIIADTNNTTAYGYAYQYGNQKIMNLIMPKLKEQWNRIEKANADTAASKGSVVSQKK